MTYPIASELSYAVLQRRRGAKELTTPETDLCHGLTQLLVQRPIVREAVSADRISGIDLRAWERMRRATRIDG